MAKLTKAFRGVPVGEIYPIQYQPGDECPPELEAGARASGALAEGNPSGGPGQEDKAELIAKKAELIAKLEAAGIEHKKSWGVDKLAAALAEGKKE